MALGRWSVGAIVGALAVASALSGASSAIALTAPAAAPLAAGPGDAGFTSVSATSELGEPGWLAVSMVTEAAAVPVITLRSLDDQPQQTCLPILFAADAASRAPSSTSGDTASTNSTWSCTFTGLPSGRYSLETYRTTGAPGAAAAIDAEIIRQDVRVPRGIPAFAVQPGVGGVFTFSGGGSPDGNVTTRIYDRSASDDPTPNTVSAAATDLCGDVDVVAGDWTCTVTLTPGHHSIAAYQLDASGFSSPATAPVSVEVAGDTTQLPELNLAFGPARVVATAQTATPGDALRMTLRHAIGSPGAHRPSPASCLTPAAGDEAVIRCRFTALDAGDYTLRYSSAAASTAASALHSRTLFLTVPAAPRILTTRMIDASGNDLRRITITGSGFPGDHVLVRAQRVPICEATAAATGSWACQAMIAADTPSIRAVQVHPVSGGMSAWSSARSLLLGGDAGTASPGGSSSDSADTTTTTDPEADGWIAPVVQPAPTASATPTAAAPAASAAKPPFGDLFEGGILLGAAGFLAVALVVFFGMRSRPQE